MVSFRNSQLQAIVVGLVVADALSQGQLPWPSGRSTHSSRWRRQAAGAIADDRWSQILSHQFQQLGNDRPSRATETVSLPKAPVELAAAPALPALLTQLPRLLRQLDSPLPTADLATSILRDGLNASWRRDETALIRLQQHCETNTTASMSPAIAAGISRAIAAVLAARGDFQLAIGQSLHESPAIVGLPVLTGILSAGWGDLSSVPGRYRHSLNQPDPGLHAWLQRRWQITDGATLAVWATDIWRSWLGLDRRATARLPVAVIPMAASSLPES